jgi:hypothetical protein
MGGFFVKYRAIAAAVAIIAVSIAIAGAGAQQKTIDSTQRIAVAPESASPESVSPAGLTRRGSLTARTRGS